ncbi:MAG: hypothetical protein U1F43_20875 [Myxococcota bacterium]
MGSVDVPRARRRFETRAWETPAGPDHAKLAAWVDGAMVAVFDLAADPAVYGLDVDLDTGRHARGRVHQRLLRGPRRPGTPGSTTSR